MSWRRRWSTLNLFKRRSQRSYAQQVPMQVDFYLGRIRMLVEQNTARVQGPVTQSTVVQTVLLSKELSKFNAENKENISPKARSTRVSNIPVRLTSSGADDDELPMPADGLEFGCAEAMEHLRQAKHALPLTRYWDQNKWLPVSRSTFYRK